MPSPTVNSGPAVFELDESELREAGLAELLTQAGPKPTDEDEARRVGEAERYAKEHGLDEVMTECFTIAAELLPEGTEDVVGEVKHQVATRLHALAPWVPPADSYAACQVPARNRSCASHAACCPWSRRNARRTRSKYQRRTST